MKSGDYQDNLMAILSGSSGGESSQESEGAEGSENDKSKNSTPLNCISTSGLSHIEAPKRSYFGFDEEDGFMKESNHYHLGVAEEESEFGATDKGKAKAWLIWTGLLH